MKKNKFKNLKINFSKICSSVLQSMPYEYRGNDIEVVIKTDEFTCLCPWSGLPDFADITVCYIPGTSVIELKSLKYYLHSFRQVGIVHESAVNTVLKDLVKCISPKSMTVEMAFKVRGGIKTTVKAEHLNV